MRRHSVYKRGKVSTSGYKLVVDFNTRVLVIFGAYDVLEIESYTGLGNRLNFGTSLMSMTSSQIVTISITGI